MTNQQTVEPMRVRCEGRIDQNQLDQFIQRLHVSAAFQTMSDDHWVFEGVGHVLIEETPFESVWNPYQIIVTGDETIIIVRTIDFDDSGSVVFAAVTKQHPGFDLQWTLSPVAVMVTGAFGSSDQFAALSDTTEWKLKVLNMLFDVS